MRILLFLLAITFSFLLFADRVHAQSKGSLKAIGQQWVWSNTAEAVVPQFVMYASPTWISDNTDKWAQDIDMFLNQHGFTGFMVPVFCTWYHINSVTCDSDLTLDTNTFSTLKNFIVQVQQAGGSVHLLMWGDCEDPGKPECNGANQNTENKKVLDGLKQHLGSTQGWSINYGFDVWEEADAAELDYWYNYAKSIGLNVMMGARNRKNNLNNLIHSESTMDYWSYEIHKPFYDTALAGSNLSYIAQFDKRTNKPVFSEDKFRMRMGTVFDEKDYTDVDTRRGMWHSVMAGGIANIWGYLIGQHPQYGYSCVKSNEGRFPSCPYPESVKSWIKKYSKFINEGKRYTLGMTVRCNELTNGWCLKTANNSHFLLYKEGTNSMTFDAPSAGMPIVALNTVSTGYTEISLGSTTGNLQTLNFPQSSDWIVAVGNFGVPAPTPTTTPSLTPSPTSSPLPPSPTPSPTPNKPGDANGDGVVDIVDYGILVSEFWQTGENLNADFDNSNVVDIIDYGILISNFWN